MTHSHPRCTAKNSWMWMRPEARPVDGHAHFYTKEKLVNRELFISVRWVSHEELSWTYNLREMHSRVHQQAHLEYCPSVRLIGSWVFSLSSECRVQTPIGGIDWICMKHDPILSLAFRSIALRTTNDNNNQSMSLRHRFKCLKKDSKI